MLGDGGDEPAVAENVAVIDGGCTDDAWHDILAFDATTLNAPQITGLRVGDGTRLEVPFEGTVKVLMCDVQGQWVEYRRPRALYVPGLRRNLISERQEWRRFNTRIFKEDTMEMHIRVTTWEDGKPSVKTHRIPIIEVGGLYAVQWLSLIHI